MYYICCIYCIYFRCRIYCSHSYSADKPISGGKEFQKLKVAGNSGASHFALCLLFLYMIEWIARRNCQFDHSHEFLAHAWKKSRSSWCFQILDSGGEVTLIKSRGHLYSSQDLRPWGQNAMHRYQVTVGDTCQLFAILKLFWKYFVFFLGGLGIWRHFIREQLAGLLGFKYLDKTIGVQSEIFDNWLSKKSFTLVQKKSRKG